MVFANGCEMPQSGADIAKTRKVGALSRFLAMVLLNYEIAVNAIFIRKIVVDVCRTLVQGHVGGCRTAEQIEGAGHASRAGSNEVGLGHQRRQQIFDSRRGYRCNLRRTRHCARKGQPLPLTESLVSQEEK